jgi:hypothetical protein
MMIETFDHHNASSSLFDSKLVHESPGHHQTEPAVA